MHTLSLHALSKISIVISSFFALSLAKSQCEICQDIVGDFNEGLQKTLKSNFGGGNTNWEENSLGKWKTSETRLVEIVEHHICTDNEKKCHMFYENHEESIEDWYFNVYKNEDSADSLKEHLCIQTSKACCPQGQYGKDCTDCPTSGGGICSSHGKCSGDGTRSGSGKCECDSGYSGELCEDCAEEYYEQLTGSIKVCLKCDVSCEDTCGGAGPKACDDCAEGYMWEDNSGCQDVDECDGEDNPCESNSATYCVNSAGSYTCEACSPLCSSCIGSKSTDCKDCIPGYEKTDSNETTSSCQDIDECSLKPELCDRVPGAICVNTEGSFDCKCKEENQRIEDGQCIDIVETAEETSTDSENEKHKETIENSNSEKGKNRKTKSKKSSKPKSKSGKDSGKPKIDIDAMVNESSKLPAGQKRKYRTLDTMTLCSATGLYLVLCLVFHAEFFKTSLVTIIYAVFIYLYSGQYA